MRVNLPSSSSGQCGMAQTVTKTVVFIHGAFCGGWCFEDFVPEFEARGFTCHVPDLRFHVSGPAREPDPQLAQTSIADYTRDMEGLVAGLPEPPVIVGHSMGGLIGQQLAAKGSRDRSSCWRRARPGVSCRRATPSSRSPWA
jgi:pimeloyl-ACP methyl ester carboxylesterase